MQTHNHNMMFSEVGDWAESHYYQVEKIHYAGKSDFQDILILETRGYGKMLVLDGRVQSAEDDEHIYHESLVHPSLIAHPAPRSVLIIGGGEGATLREVLRHPTVERAVMVDIDREVVEQCRKFMPEWHQGAFDDPRAQVVFADGKSYVENTAERFDCVIIDICDVLEESPALALYTEGFYQSVKKCLRPGGLVIVQAMELNEEESDDHLTVHELLGRVFRHVGSYAQYIASFWSNWGFVVASDSIDVMAVSRHDVDTRLRQRRLEKVLAHYDGETHAHMFALPKGIRDVLREARERQKDVA